MSGILIEKGYKRAGLRTHPLNLHHQKSGKQKGNVDRQTARSEDHDKDLKDTESLIKVRQNRFASFCIFSFIRRAVTEKQLCMYMIGKHESIAGDNETADMATDARPNQWRSRRAMSLCAGRNIVCDREGAAK